jgi:hypothetical protein
MYFYEFYIAIEDKKLFSASNRINSIQYIYYLRLLTHYGLNLSPANVENMVSS